MRPFRTKLIASAIVSMMVVDVAVALVVGKDNFDAMTWTDFLLMVMDGVTTWTGRVVWVIAVIMAGIAALFRGKPPGKVSSERVIHMALDTAGRALRDTRTAIGILAVFSAVLPVTIWLGQRPAEALPPPGHVLSTVDLPLARRQIFVAVESQGEVQVFEADYVQRPAGVIALGNPIDRGLPQSLAASRRGVNGELYIADARTNQLVVADLRTHRVLAAIEVGRGPRSVVVTPDERTAYVGNEQPAPHGTISEVDLHERRVKRTIQGVNCPEGLAISPNGKRLYVVTQCGGGQDPVFVIETATGRVERALRGFAVGLAVAITPDGRKLYVARGGFGARDAVTDGVRQVPPQLSVIDTETYETLRDLQLSVTALALTGNGKYLLAGGDRGIAVVSTADDRVVNTLPVGSPPRGIAVTKQGSAYVWLPEERRVFLTGLGELLSKQ